MSSSPSAKEKALEAEIERLRGLLQQAGIDARTTATRYADETASYRDALATSEATLARSRAELALSESRRLTSQTYLTAAERSNAELLAELLEASASRSQTILEGVLDFALVTLSPTGEITGWNDGARHTLGWEKEQILGRHVRVLFSREDQEAGVPEQQLRTALSTGRATDERWYVRANGTRFRASGELTRLSTRDGRTHGFLKLLRDHTAEHLAATQARLDRERLDMLVHQASVGITQAELTGTIVMANQRFCDLVGRPREEVLGRSAQPLTHPEDWEATTHHYQRLRETYEPYTQVKRYVRPDGEIIWVHNHVSLARDARGHPEFVICVTQDITARKQAEEALRRATERIDLALSAGAVIGTWVWDIPTDRFTADERFAKSFSIDPQQAAQGLPLSVFVESIYPEDRERVMGLVARAMEIGGPYRAEYRVRQLDGSYLWLEANGHCQLSPEGRPLRFPGVLINIDERKKAELRQAALIELGDRLRDLDDTSTIATTAMEIVGRLFGCLRAGYGTIDAAQRHVDIARDWTSRPDVAHIAGTHQFAHYGVFSENLKRGETVVIPDVEEDPRTLSGVGNLRAIGIRALLNVPLLEHGRFVALLFLHDEGVRHWSTDECEFMRNVADRIWAASARAKAVAELRRANETLEQRVEQRTRERDRLWNVSQELLLVADMEGRFLSVNPAWTELLGWTEQELLGKTSAWMEHPDDQAKTRAEVAHLAGGHRTMRFENSFRHRDGSYRHLSWTAVPMAEEGMIYAFARDITDQRQAEEQLRQAQKMEAVGQLTGGVAHDFNNLLQIIGGNLQLLQRDVSGNERAQGRLRSAVGAVDRGARLAAQLLAFARRQPLEPLVFNLGRLVRGMDELLRRALGENIEVRTLVGGELWNTFADPNQLENVILNLAINARDAMEGNGRLLIEVGNAPLDEHYAHTHSDVVPGPYVLLAVSDNGSGMPPEVVKRVFEPFFTTKPEGRGTGLGLSMVYGFVKQSGGHIHISSEVGVGTTVKIYLPRALQAESASSELIDGPVEGGSETILVVEDDAEVRATVVEMLNELGYSVLKAVDGQSAWAILQSGIPVDLLFTDVVMPGPMRSTELVRQAKELLPDLEVLFTSGYTEDTIVHDGRLDPGVQLLSKPHRREDLARKVRHMLNNRQQRLAVRAAPVPKAPAPKQKTPGPTRLRVLLVEDDDDIRTSASELLDLLGHEVLAVASAEEAQRALEANNHDVLFTDVTLPGMSGVELVREARTRWPTLKVILASGHGSSALTADGGRLDDVVVLPKPYALPQIQRALEQVVASR